MSTSLLLNRHNRFANLNTKPTFPQTCRNVEHKWQERTQLGLSKLGFHLRAIRRLFQLKIKNLKYFSMGCLLKCEVKYSTYSFLEVNSLTASPQLCNHTPNNIKSAHRVCKRRAPSETNMLLMWISNEIGSSPSTSSKRTWSSEVLRWSASKRVCIRQTEPNQTCTDSELTIAAQM